MKNPASLDWIRKRDGRLVPFEADKISQSLFAAGESLNRPDAFTARELTDGVLHFLVAELNGSVPNTSQVADVVIKVVRELGQLDIADAYANFAGRRHLVPKLQVGNKREEGNEGARNEAGKAVGKKERKELPSPEVAVRHDPRLLMRAVAGTCFQDYSLREIFTRDIAAAHEEGLVTIASLETPFEIQGGVLAPVEIGRLVETIEESRSNIGQFIAVDGPEFTDQTNSATSTASWVREFCIGLRATGLRAVVNLNSGIPPSWAQSLATGPLFAEKTASSIHESDRPADWLLDQILAEKSSFAQIHWHLGERDFLPKNGGRIHNLTRWILEGSPLTLAFDRPGQPISLAEGLDRRYSALLIAVGLHLPRLAQQPGVRAAPDVFLRKLGSLTRLALTAAIQKRRFLTRHRRRQPAFLVDRARLAVVPVGLEAVTRIYTGQGIVPGSPGAEFACRIGHRLYEILQEEEPLNNLIACLDSPPMMEFRPEFRSPLSDWEPEATPAQGLDQKAGLTTWNEAISVRDQIQAAGLLQVPGRAGTAWVLLPKDNSCNPEELGNILRFAWKETGVSRIRFVSGYHSGRQLIAPWEER